VNDTSITASRADLKAAPDTLDGAALRQVLDAIPVALYTTDPEGRLTFYNRPAAELWGRNPQLGAEPVVERPDGTRVPFAAFPTPLKDADGRIIGAVNVLIDISDRKRDEQRHDALLNELNHRVKNTLATVQAIASQTIRGRGIKRELRTKFVGRLFALSRVHDLLAREGWHSADARAAIEQVLAPHHGRIEARGESLSLSPKMALTLGMALHELAGNAVAHGALSTPTGKVAVSWTIDSGPSGAVMTLDWRETNGPHVVAPARRGFGLKLVERSIVQELRGRADIIFAPEGFRCVLSFPIAEKAAP
jgi:two-component sensor histidine kinase